MGSRTALFNLSFQGNSTRLRKGKLPSDQLAQHLARAVVLPDFRRFRGTAAASPRYDNRFGYPTRALFETASCQA